MEESSIEPKIAEQPVEVTAQLKSNMVLLGIGAFVFILLGLAGGYFLFGNKAAKVSQSTPQPTSSVSPSVETNKTASWRTFKITHVGMEFKLPPGLANNEYKEEVTTAPEGSNAATGSSLCIQVYKKSISFLQEAYAGGFGCYWGKDDVFFLGGTSPDFSAGREGTFYDMQGFVAKDQKYFAKFVRNELIDITDIAQSFNNPNSVEIVKLKGKSSEGPSLWPQEGYIGALINTKDATYKGLSVMVKLSDIDEATFDEILSTFKFTDKKNVADDSSISIQLTSKKRFYEGSEEFFRPQHISYASVLPIISDSELQTISCSSSISVGDIQRSQVNNYSFPDKDLNLLISQIKSKYPSKTINDLIFCKTQQNKLVVMYLLGPCGGGCEGISYIGVSDTSVFKELAKIEHNTAFFGCTQPLMFSNSSDFYFECGGGDGPGLTAAIYKVNTDSAKLDQLKICEANGSENGTTTSSCK